MAISGNKGEWSEIYTLFKLLGDGVVYSGDGNMNKMNNLFYPILDIIRKEESGEFHYSPNGNVVVISENQQVLLSIPSQDFQQQAGRLLRLIQTTKGAAFELPTIEAFMKSIYCDSLKARSEDKSDIHIVIHDLRTGMKPLLGFSIKSQLGHPSTLLNPGKTTNFVYRIDGVTLSDSDIQSINSIESQNDRMTALFAMGGTLSYAKMDCETFEDNLMIVDSCMPEIVAECIKEHYISMTNDLSSLVDGVIARNPLGVRNARLFYSSKVKSLLIDAALGMTPAKVWTRVYDATGGYLVVRSDGEVICYHFYNRNQLEDYLFNNTRFDYPSRSRYDYGYLFRDGVDVRVKLNFQVRFK